MSDSTQRFSDRVTDYVKYRPTYPRTMIEDLVSRGAFAEGTVVDVGSGTGILTRLLAPHFAHTIGVEPNAEMRRAGEAVLAGDPRFTSVAATAEETMLPDASVDLITVAQAFHWFDRVKTKREFRRILKAHGLLALIWNDRLNDTPFLVDYDAALRRYATDYNEVNHQNVTPDDLARFFGGPYEQKNFPNAQEFDLAGVLGRLDSSSYAPKPGTRNYDIIRSLLTDSFAQNAQNGRVSFRYSTRVYVGELH